MKTGKSLVELATEIQRQSENKKDFIAPTTKMELIEVAGVPLLSLGEKPARASNVFEMDRRNEFTLNDLAHGQLSEFVGIPKAYYDRMKVEAPALLAKNVNNWLPFAGKDPKTDAPVQRMVRTLDGSVRAILSDRYRPLENSDLAEAILPVLIEQDLFIVSCEITATKIYIKAFDKRIEREIKVKGSDPRHTFLKDVVFPSITISNSEVGCGALSIAAGIYTGGCTNFASFSDSRMKKYHTGQRASADDAVYALLTDKTKQLTDAAVWAQTRDVVKSAFEIARFEELVGRVQQTTEQKIEGDVVKLIELTGDRFEFNKAEKQSVLRHLIQGGDLSRYGLFNAVTRTAEDLMDYDRATEFERVGGKLIELPANDWVTLAQAA